MDRRTQSFLITLVIVLILSCLNCSGQCSDSIKLVYTADSCERVEMSLDRFDEMYQAKVNLDAIKEAIPETDAKLDSLMALQKSQNKDYQKQLDAANKKASILEQGKKDCNQRLINVEIDNMQKANRIKELKKKKFVRLGSVGVLGILLGFILSSISA